MPSQPSDFSPKPLCPENYTAAEVVRLLALEPLPQEGGFFRRTAESQIILTADARRLYSVIYSFLTPEDFSAMHRMSTDEIWCFHAGDSVESLRLRADG